MLLFGAPSWRAAAGGAPRRAAASTAAGQSLSRGPLSPAPAHEALLDRFWEVRGPPNEPAAALCGGPTHAHAHAARALTVPGMARRRGACSTQARGAGSLRWLRCCCRRTPRVSGAAAEHDEDAAAQCTRARSAAARPQARAVSSPWKQPHHCRGSPAHGCWGTGARCPRCVRRASRPPAAS